MIRFLLSILMFGNISLLAIEPPETQKNRMLSDLSIIKKTFEESYPAADWKGELFGWDLESQFQTSTEEIMKIKGNDIKEFQKILVKFCKSMRDYHVNILFSSTEYASLPFDVRYRNGKYIVTSVYSNEKHSVAVGDEILMIDEVPIKTVVAQLQEQLGVENNPATDHALALEILTMRSGRLGHDVPKGIVSLKVRKFDSNQIVICQAKWDYNAERISNPFNKQPIKNQEDPSNLILNELGSNFTIPYYQEMNEVFPDKGVPTDRIGSRKSMFSTMAKQEMKELNEHLTEQQISWIWEWLWKKSPPVEAQDFFDAQLLVLPSGKRIGFMRIPTYGEDDQEKAFEAFLSGVKFFQREADGLILDQTNNPGGSLNYTYALSATLTDKPLIAFKVKRKLSQNAVLEAIDKIDWLTWNLDFNESIVNRIAVLGMPLKEKFNNSLLEANFFVEQWDLGKVLTDPYPEFGMQTVNPHPEVNFTKPLFILANERSFSCADIFPALFQDNDRATIIGTPTAGAVGRIERMSFKNLNGIQQVTYSASILYRLDGAPLENLGVVPDIYFDFKEELYGEDNLTLDFSKLLNIVDSLL